MHVSINPIVNAAAILPVITNAMIIVNIEE